MTHPGKCSSNQFTVVTFHRVLPEYLRQQYPFPGLCVTPEELRWFCNFFQQYFTVGSHTQLYQRWLNKEQPKKPFLAVTFDDGQLDNLEYALPVLKSFDFNATFYIPVIAVEDKSILWHDRIGYATRMAKKQGEAITKKVLDLATDYGIPSIKNQTFENHLVEQAKLITPENRLKLLHSIEALLNSSPPVWGRLMTWDEIRQVQSAGHEIGSHSMTHTLMPQCSEAELAYEISVSKQMLEKELGSDIQSFCYPNGDYDQRAMAMTKQSGYHNAVTTAWGKNNHGDSFFSLKRCDINTFNNWNAQQQLSEARFALRLSGLQPGL